MAKKEVKIIRAYKLEAFEGEIERKLAEGFIFIPETFKCAVSKDGQFVEFVIMMFRGENHTRLQRMGIDK